MRKTLIFIGITLLLFGCTGSGHNQQSWQPKTHHHMARYHHR